MSRFVILFLLVSVFSCVHYSSAYSSPEDVVDPEHLAKLIKEEKLGPNNVEEYCNESYKDDPLSGSVCEYIVLNFVLTYRDGVEKIIPLPKQMMLPRKPTWSEYLSDKANKLLEALHLKQKSNETLTD